MSTVKRALIVCAIGFAVGAAACSSSHRSAPKSPGALTLTLRPGASGKEIAAVESRLTPEAAMVFEHLPTQHAALVGTSTTRAVSPTTIDVRLRLGVDPRAVARRYAAIPDVERVTGA